MRTIEFELPNSLIIPKRGFECNLAQLAGSGAIFRIRVGMKFSCWAGLDICDNFSWTFSCHKSRTQHFRAFANCHLTAKYGTKCEFDSYFFQFQHFQHLQKFFPTDARPRCAYIDIYFLKEKFFNIYQMRGLLLKMQKVNKHKGLRKMLFFQKMLLLHFKLKFIET